MLIDVTFRHMDSTDALKQHAVDKIGHLERYFDQVHEAHVVLTAEKNNHIAEVTLHSTGDVFKAAATTEDMYHSIDQVLEKLERHLKKRKELVKNNKHHKPPLEQPDVQAGG